MIKATLGFLKEILRLFSYAAAIGIPGGFLLAYEKLSFTFHHVLDNRYYQYKLFRLAALGIKDSLSYWLKTALILTFILFILGLFWKKVMAGFIREKFNPKWQPYVLQVLIISSLFFLFFICFLNRVLRTPFYHSSSLFWTLGILLFTVLTAGILLKMRWNVGIITSFAGNFFTVIFILLAIFRLGLVVQLRSNLPATPNVIFLLIDTLRKDHLGLYGYLRDTTPRIDRFSKTATVFQNATSQCSWTSPSIASIFTGLYPSVHGLNSYSFRGNTGQADILDHRLVTFTEVLKENGYATGAFVANHWINRKLGFGQGFDVFDPIDIHYKPRARTLIEHAITWIDKNKKRPFFAYLHFMDVHGPYEPPGQFSSYFKSEEPRIMSPEEAKKIPGIQPEINDLNHYIAQYDGEIRYTDVQIDRFLQQLQDSGLLENSIVVIAADHGEAFLEHGFGDHGWSLYEEEIAVPLIIKFPESLPEPMVSEEHIELIDISVTILRLLKCRFPYNVDGLDLSLVNNTNSIKTRQIISEELSEEILGPPKSAMIWNQFKAVYQISQQAVTELYDLKNDKQEQENLAHIFPDICEQFKKMIELWRRAKLHERQILGLKKSSSEITDISEIERLKALGYFK